MERTVLAGLLAVIVVADATAAPRVWTDTDGNSIQAEFVRESDGEVSFLEDGKLITMRLDQLSEQDQQVVRDLQAGSPVVEERISGSSSPRPSDLPTPGMRKLSDRPTEKTAFGENTVPKVARRKPVETENRVWTDVFGNQMTAKFVRVFDGYVVLSRIGRLSRVRFYDLTASDQEYIKEWLTSQGDASLIPPPLHVQSVDPGNSPIADSAPLGQGVPAPAAAMPGFVARDVIPRGGPSELFEEMRRRDEERRQQHAERLAEDEAQSAEARLRQHRVAAQNGDQASQTDSVEDRATEGNAPGPSPIALQAQKWVILLVVVGAVVGVVSVIVFTAMTIASASSVAKQRHYR